MFDTFQKNFPVTFMGRVLGHDPAADVRCVCVCCCRLVCETVASWETMSDHVTVSVAGNAVGVSKDVFSFVVRTGLSHLPHPSFTLLSSSWRIFPSHPSLCFTPPSPRRLTVSPTSVWHDGVFECMNSNNWEQTQHALEIGLIHCKWLWTSGRVCFVWEFLGRCRVLMALRDTALCL